MVKVHIVRQASSNLRSTGRYWHDNYGRARDQQRGRRSAAARGYDGKARLTPCADTGPLRLNLRSLLAVPMTETGSSSRDLIVGLYR